MRLDVYDSVGVKSVKSATRLHARPKPWIVGVEQAVDDLEERVVPHHRLSLSEEAAASPISLCTHTLKVCLVFHVKVMAKSRKPALVVPKKGITPPKMGQVVAGVTIPRQLNCGLEIAP
jgi:hypothetical protein